MQQKLILTGTHKDINALIEEICARASIHNVEIEAPTPESRQWLEVMEMTP